MRKGTIVIPSATVIIAVAMTNGSINNDRIDQSAYKCTVGIQEFVSTKIVDLYGSIPINDVVFSTKHVGYKLTNPMVCYTNVTVRMTRVHASQTKSVQDEFLVRTSLKDNQHNWALTDGEKKGIVGRLMWIDMINHELRQTFFGDKQSKKRAASIREAIKLLDTEQPPTQDVKQ